MSGLIGENSRKSAPLKGRSASKREGDTTRISLMNAYNEWNQQKKKIEAFLRHTRDITGANKKDFRTTLSHSQFAWHLLTSHKSMCSSCRSFVYHDELSSRPGPGSSSCVMVKTVCSVSTQTEESLLRSSKNLSVPVCTGTPAPEIHQTPKASEMLPTGVISQNEGASSSTIPRNNDPWTVHCIADVEEVEESPNTESSHREDETTTEAAGEPSVQETEDEDAEGDLGGWIHLESEEGHPDGDVNNDDDDYHDDVVIMLQVDTSDTNTLEDVSTSGDRVADEDTDPVGKVM